MKGKELFQEKKVFDIKTTGMPLYNDMLRLPDYFRDNKGKTFKIEQMSPDQYIKQIATKIFKGYTLAQIYDLVDHERIKKYAKMMERGVKFPMPVLDLDHGSQEGRHRTLAAKELGIKKIPVMVVRTAK